MIPDNWRFALQKTLSFGCCFNESSNMVVIGVPLDLSATYKPGTKLAPERIRIAACNLELYSTITGKCLENICFNDVGDIVIPPGDLFGSLEMIKYVVENVYREYRGRVVSYIGGEHLITYPIVRALKGEIDTLVVFDAHLDLRNEYLGSKWNHATVFRRLLEEVDVPIIFIGARAISSDELSFLKETNSIEVIDLFKALENDLELRSLGRTYISIDIDVLDPGYAPGVSNPEPFGLTPIKLLKHVREVVKYSEKIVGFDIVEVNPLVDVNDTTSLLASKLVFEISSLAVG
ncbi:MAG: agmatinase [Desulfurococcaceae archaeon]